jgi:hypothetical protein
MQIMPMPERSGARRDGWLAALEKELRSRVGWVDEAVSPFAIGRRRARGKSPRPLLPAGKAA